MLYKTLLAGLFAMLIYADSFYKKIQPQQNQFYIYVLKYTEQFKKSVQWSEKETSIAKEHVLYIKELVEEGKGYLLGRTPNVYDPNLFGVFVFEASSKEEAETILQNDPIVKNDIMEGTISPFSVLFLKEKRD